MMHTTACVARQRCALIGERVATRGHMIGQLNAAHGSLASTDSKYLFTSSFPLLWQCSGPSSSAATRHVPCPWLARSVNRFSGGPFYTTEWD